MFQRILTLIIISLLIYVGCTGPLLSRGSHFKLRPGDILFQDTDFGDLSEAIEKTVAIGWRGAVFSHVGLVMVDEERQMAVIESWADEPSGVRMTPLRSFLERSLDIKGRPKVVVGRVYPNYQHLIPDALQEAKQLIGKPYDPYFSLDNDAYYCTELIYEVFKRANHDNPIFELSTVSFTNPDTNESWPFWDQWFFQLGRPTPQELQIADPGMMSKSPKLRIVHMYGIPSLRMDP